MRYNHFDMLPERAFLKVGGRITLEGGGGGGGQQQSTQTSYQTNIPAYLEDPAKRMVSRGETLSEQGYQPYTGARTAGFTPAQERAFTEIGGMTTPEQYAGAGTAIDAAQRFGTTGALGAMGYAPGTFGTEQAARYMSPYQQAVTDIAKREATTEAAMLNRELGAKAAKAGAFGGSRFGIEQALLGSKLATNLSDIQTKGLQDAYLNAQQQYERDRAAGLAGSKFNLEGAQFGADVGLKSASQLQNLGTAEQEADLKRIAAQQSAGAQQQALEQQKLDAAYQQFVEQRDWEKNQLGFLSGLIRGTPFSTSQLQSTSAPGATTASTIASLGLGAYGLSSLLGKKDGGAIKGYADGGSVEGYAYGGDIKGLTDQQLQEAAMGKSDIISPEDAKQELGRRSKLRTAVQGVRAEEELTGGLAALPADNMEFADGGIIGYDEGGSVLSRWWDRVNAGADDYVKRENERARLGTKGGWLGLLANQSDAEYEAAKKEREALAGSKPATTAAPAASAAKKDEAPAAAPAAGPARAPRVTPPGTPAAGNVVNTLAAGEEPSWMKDIRARWTKSDEANAAMAEEIAKGQQDVNAIRGDVKGIAALRAAAAIAQGGPGGTLGQIGRGLGAAGEEAQRGINLMQSARQGLMGQRIQLAQLERQAAQGDVNAMLVLREMGLKEPLYKAQAEQARAYAELARDKGNSLGASGGAGLASTRLYAQQLDKAIKDFGIPTTAADKLRLADLKRQRDALLSQLTPGGAGSSVSTLPKGAVVAND